MGWPRGEPGSKKRESDNACIDNAYINDSESSVKEGYFARAKTKKSGRVVSELAVLNQ